MDERTWEVVEQLRDWLDAESGVTGDLAKVMRVLKISEEAGEVAEAVHGAMGTNPRKGASHTWDDVQQELCDVTVTALIALASITPDARKVFTEYLQRIPDRSPHSPLVK
jgi:NTP pyrophosphatase (non-canonical NTP hydrolase)